MRWRPTRRTALVGALSALAGPALTAGPEDVPPSAASQVRPAIPRRDVTALRLEDGRGTPVPLSGYAGQLLVVNLWATWCLPCRREMPSLARLAIALRDAPIQVLPLSFDPLGPAAVRRFYREVGVTTLPVLIGDAHNLKATLGIERLPTTLVLDGTAHHLATVAGEATWDDAETEAWLRQLV